jgi:hypothetical protein
MSSDKLSSSLMELSRAKLQDFLNLTTSNSSNCDTKHNTSSSSSTKHKHKSKTKHHKKKSHKSKNTYTTTTSSSKCPSSSCSLSSCSTSNCSSSCPSTSTSSKCSSSKCSSSSCSTSKCSTSSCSSSSSSCNPCKVKCPSYALKCNTYKSIGGTVLIPGPQGQPSTSMANFSGICNEELENVEIATYTSYGSQVNIIDNVGVLTFSLSGKYLFQYNIYVSSIESEVSVRFELNSSTYFGTQTIPDTGSYGCSVIQDITLGDTVSLNFTDDTTLTFVSVSIIKL